MPYPNALRKFSDMNMATDDDFAHRVALGFMSVLKSARPKDVCRLAGLKRPSDLDLLYVGSEKWGALVLASPKGMRSLEKNYKDYGIYVPWLIAPNQEGACAFSLAAQNALITKTSVSGMPLLQLLPDSSAVVHDVRIRNENTHQPLDYRIPFAMVFAFGTAIRVDTVDEVIEDLWARGRELLDSQVFLRTSGRPEV